MQPIVNKLDHGIEMRFHHLFLQGGLQQPAMNDVSLAIQAQEAQGKTALGAIAGSWRANHVESLGISEHHAIVLGSKSDQRECPAVGKSDKVASMLKNSSKSGDRVMTDVMKP
jgi:hypothetical protein